MPIVLTDMAKQMFGIWSRSNDATLRTLVSKLADWDALVFSIETFGRGTLYAEYHDPAKNAHKFYAVEVDTSTQAYVNGTDVIVRWGRVGTKGTTQRVSLEVARLRWASKLSKGYEPLSNKYAATPFANLTQLDWCPISDKFDAYVKGIPTPIAQLPTKSAIDLYLSTN